MKYLLIKEINSQPENVRRINITFDNYEELRIHLVAMLNLTPFFKIVAIIPLP